MTGVNPSGRIHLALPPLVATLFWREFQFMKFDLHCRVEFGLHVMRNRCSQQFNLVHCVSDCVQETLESFHSKTLAIHPPANF